MQFVLWCYGRAKFDDSLDCAKEKDVESYCGALRLGLQSFHAAYLLHCYGRRIYGDMGMWVVAREAHLYGFVVLSIAIMST